MTTRADAGDGGRTGVSERLLRYYEDRGLLRPERLPSGYREYAESDVDLVGRIRTLPAAGRWRSRANCWTAYCRRRW
ncbi:MerR family transcriptional regulator [Kribbella turkmenica]|uniref:MerR family transcriptional regulator n=1 Tax=Kribbella turkmenica TaxID=2530375 RepID=A0A4V2YDE5_9ACTN|nr:MerR family transcriptional regulator [Kribbella turkmenica]TDD15156.1 MerR family transcriptional regulator [Kribbella turkmenica]